MKINLEGLKELTPEEIATLRIMMDEREKRLSNGLKDISATDSMHEVYVSSLVTLHKIYDKIFPVNID